MKTDSRILCSVDCFEINKQQYVSIILRVSICGRPHYFERYVTPIFFSTIIFLF
jgi:hypothetical protein